MQASGAAATRPMISFGCWADLYEGPNFQGKLRRVFGPSVYFKLRKSASNWGIEVQSLMIGPGAYARCYHGMEGNGGVWLKAGARIASIAELENGSDIESLQLLDHEPTAQEMGSGSFAGQAERESPAPETDEPQHTIRWLHGATRA